MVIGPVPLLIMVKASSMGLGFDRKSSETFEHIGSDGVTGVDVGVTGVNVNVGVTGVLVRVTGAKVFVGGLVFVGPGVFVFVAVTMAVGLGEEVEEGSTNSVLVAGMVAEGVNVRDGVSVSVGVDVIWPCICPCASLSETGMIASCEQ